jgi:predicted anti-sigma-YlaC factor YlaD
VTSVTRRRARHLSGVDCEACARLLPDFLDGALLPEGMGEVEAHLQHCQSCASVVRDCIAVARIVRGATDVPLPPDARVRIRGYLAERFKRPRGRDD